MIAIQAVYKSFRSLVDGGLVLTFDIDKSNIDHVTQVAKLEGENLFLVVMTEAEYLNSQVNRG